MLQDKVYQLLLPQQEPVSLPIGKAMIQTGKVHSRENLLSEARCDHYGANGWRTHSNHPALQHSHEYAGKRTPVLVRKPITTALLPMFSSASSKG
jgi:hypothetical protein